MKAAVIAFVAFESAVTLALLLGAISSSSEQKDTIKDLKSSNADLLRFYSVEKARSYELEKRSFDRDKIELDLRACLGKQATALSHFEDLKWQMDATISSCPGRSRPPSLPRP